MKTLIAGFGSIGRRHFRNLLALGQEDILFYRTRRSTLPEDELRDYPVETDLQVALAHKPDAVIIANPTAAHLDVAISAARAGCHILMEKPVSHNLARIQELETAVAENHVRVLVGYQFRFHPVLQQVKTLLQDGMIGRPISVRAQWGEYLPAWHPWEDYRKSYSALGELGGGVVLTLSHPLDYLRWFFGEVDSLWAFAGQVSDLELKVDDFAEIGMRFASGVYASLHVNYFQRPPVHQLEILGSNGTLTWDNADGGARYFSAGQEEWQMLPAPQGFERNQLFIDELRHFLDLVAGKCESVCSLADGKAALVLAQAVLKSAKNCELVKV